MFLSLDELDKRRVGLAGSSYGGFLAAFLSDEFDFKSLALIVPAAYSDDGLNTYHTDDKEILRKDFEKSSSYEKIRDFKNNLIVFQSELEDVLPEGMVEKYLDVAINVNKKEHVVLKGAKHRIKLNPEAKNKLLEELIRWFKETL